MPTSDKMLSTVWNDANAAMMMPTPTVPLTTWPHHPTNDTSIHSHSARMPPNTSTNVISETDENETVLMALILHSYYTPSIVVIGSIGNILSVVIFFRLKMRKLSSSFYLAALGISDTIFLLSNSSNWAMEHGIEKLINLELFCKVTNYLCGVSSVLSSWFVVAFTLERFIVVLYPLKRQTICTVKRAKTISSGILAGGLIHSLPLLYYFGYTIRDESCWVEKEVSYFKHLFENQRVFDDIRLCHDTHM